MRRERLAAQVARAHSEHLSATRPSTPPTTLAAKPLIAMKGAE
jgi:hypothetical protein